MSVRTDSHRYEKGRSLWQDALRRLLKNRMAVVGGIVTLLLAGTAIFAEWIVPVDPTHQERHYRYRPPGETHLTTPERLVLVEGEATPSYPAPRYRLVGERRFHFVFRPQVVRGVHVMVGARSGRVKSIRRTQMDASPEKVDSVAVEGPDEFFGRGAGEDRVRWNDQRIQVGLALPEVFRDKLSKPSRGRQKLLLDQVVQGEPQELAFTLEADQTVRGLTHDGEPVESFDLQGRLVTELTRNGVTFEHSHLLGQDMHGRDLFSRLVFGARISFLIGMVATTVSLFIGVFYGAVAGWVGGRVGGIMMRFVDILYGLPYLFLVIILMVSIGRNVLVLFLALGAVQWLTMARIVRGQVLSLKEKEYIEASLAAGGSGWWILTRHLIPNTLGIVAVYGTLTVPAVILQESFLSFLGLSPEWNGKPLESWGALIWTGVQAMGTGQNLWLLIYPALTLSVTLFAMNFLGDGLRDAFDPQMKGRS